MPRLLKLLSPDAGPRDFWTLTEGLKEFYWVA
jgi:hypothetical protein